MKLFTLLSFLFISLDLFSAGIDIKFHVRFDDNIKKTVKKRFVILTMPLNYKKKVKGTFASITGIIQDSYLKKHLQGQKKFFLLETDQRYFLSLIFDTITKEYGEDSLCFTDVTEIKAYTKDNKKCHGHPILFRNRSGRLRLAYLNNSLYLKKRLKAYNFGYILEGMISRSGQLGEHGIKAIVSEFEAIDQPIPRSIASIHIMGFGGKDGDYNLHEIKECKKRGITFLHSYHHDPKLTVYMDGKDPSNIDLTSSHHGNIYNPDTLDRYVPLKKVRKHLKIGESIKAGRKVIGDVMDFLQTVENIIDAPWPIHIHCKGGKHKTGMLGIFFKFLAYHQAMAERYSREISVFDLSQGILFKKFSLRPAEIEYAEYNGNIYRHSNIEFMRRMTSGELLENPTYKEKWDIINEKFRKKIRNYIISVKFHTPIL